MTLSERCNIAVRSGLHCAPLAHQSFKTDDKGTVRAVVSAFTTQAQVNYFADCIKRLA